MRTSIILAVIALFSACAGEPANDPTAAQAGRTVKEVPITSGTPMASADLGITGMTCEQMCGGMIKGALTKLPGVTGAEIAFKDGDAVGHAKVTYDPAKVDDLRFVQAVQALAGGQYKVVSLAVVKEVKQSAAAKHGGKPVDDEVSASILPEVTMPNLVATLLSLVRI